MSFFIKKEEGERVMCKCQNQKMKWIIAISDTCNDEINLKFLTATEDEAKQLPTHHKLFCQLSIYSKLPLENIR